MTMTPSNLVERANHVMSPVQGHYFKDFTVTSGKGCYLFDESNKKYLDFASGIGVASTGHCHEDVVKAIQTQAATLIHTSFGIAYYRPNIELAEEIGKLMGHGLTSVFFGQSGSEAMEASIKLARYVTGKSGIIAFQGGFHGRTLGSLSLTTSKNSYRDGYAPLLEGARFFPYPYLYHSPWGDSGSEDDRMGITALNAYFDGLDDSIAAAVIEPVLGEGGYVPAPKRFLETLAELCRKKGILLIFDEVQSGFGKTGEWFAFQHYGVIPDIVALAKGIASGMPLGACVSRPELMARWKTGAHGSTYGGNPVTCAAGLATVKVLKRYVPNVTKRGERMLAYLREALGKNPFVGDIRGVGYMIGIELVTDKKTKEPHKELIRKVMDDCLKNGLVVISCGVKDNVIRLIPPLIISEAEFRQGLSILIGCLNDYH